MKGPRKRALYAASMFGIAVAAATLACGTSALGAGGSDTGSFDTNVTTEVTVEERAKAFEITQLTWTEDATGRPALQVGPGQDERLVDCGSDAMPSSMTALAPDGIAYCVRGFDESDPLSISAARIVGLQLTGKGPFTEAELRYLDLQLLSGYADQESPDAARYWTELRQAWDRLSPAEQHHLNS